MKKYVPIVLISCLLVAYQADPSDFKYEKNYLKSLQKSKQEYKPIFVQFNGLGCFRWETENNFNSLILTSYDIQNRLNNQFISLKLNVDYSHRIKRLDTLGLYQLLKSPEAKEKYNRARNIGNINASIQLELFNNNKNPYYGFIDHQWNLLTEPFELDTITQAFFVKKMDEAELNYAKKK